MVRCWFVPSAGVAEYNCIAFRKPAQYRAWLAATACAHAGSAGPSGAGPLGSQKVPWSPRPTSSRRGPCCHFARSACTVICCPANGIHDRYMPRSLMLPRYKDVSGSGPPCKRDGAKRNQTGALHANVGGARISDLIARRNGRTAIRLTQAWMLMSF
jgi:hypothetical protein